MTVTASNLSLFSTLAIELNPPDLDPEVAAKQGPRSYTLTAETLLNPTVPNMAVVRVDVLDPDGNSTSTTAVLNIVASTNSAPSITNTSASYQEQLSSESSAVHAFTVSDSNLSGDQLKVSAFSSNTDLVPNDLANNIIVTQPGTDGSGTVEIVPILSLPPPSPGRPQTSTITLSVTDDAYTRRTTFLYVLPPTTAGTSTLFSRPAGVYSLQPTTTIAQTAFVTGCMHSFQWDELEDEAGYDFQPIRDAMNLLPLGEDLEFDLKKEPCYVANEAHDPPVREYEVWCDTDMGTQPTHCGDQLSLCTDGFRRAVPWDSYLWQTRDSFLDQLETYLNNTTDDHGITLIDRISIINPGLPGLEDGLRNAVVPFRDPDMPGYTRVNLLRAIGHELRSVQDHFPGKLLQIGFYTQLIDEVTDPPLWEWLYKDATNDPTAVDPDGVHLVALADEFNGVRRPRISFFEDNLAAARTPNPPAGILPSSNAPNHSTPPDITAYTISPTSSFLPTFESFPDPTDEELNIIYNSGYTFQANTIWSNPFTGSQGDKLTKTINGTPNDAMEGAFNAFLSQYLEIYPADIDEASPSSGDLATLNAELLEGELRSWHDYAAHLRTDVTPLEPPAGLTVERTASDDNVVKWHAVYGATSYSVQTITFGTSSPTWVDAVCEPGAAIECQDFAPKGAQYGYRVRASNGDGSITTDWAYVAVFLSEGVNDGYVRMNGTVVNDTTEPAIAAGRVTGMNNFRGFLSFNTSALDGATVPAAKLRMYESVGSAFDPSHPCYIDVKKGSFNDNEMLEAADFAALETDTNVAQMQPLESPLSAPDWFEAEILPTYLADINTSNDDTNHTGRTQFRLYFTTLDTNKQATWYSGDSTDVGEADRPPQLIVQYEP